MIDLIIFGRQNRRIIIDSPAKYEGGRGGGGCGLTETAATACFPDGADLSTEHL